MLKTNHWKAEIKENLKKCLAALVVLLLLISIPACQHATVKNQILKKKKNEIWLVDGEQLVLFRVISDTKEQILQIKDNPAMNNFMCIDKTEADYWIESGVDRE